MDAEPTRIFVGPFSPAPFGRFPEDAYHVASIDGHPQDWYGHAPWVAAGGAEGGFSFPESDRPPFPPPEDPAQRFEDGGNGVLRANFAVYARRRGELAPWNLGTSRPVSLAFLFWDESDDWAEGPYADVVSGYAFPAAAVRRATFGEGDGRPYAIVSIETSWDRMRRL